MTTPYLTTASGQRYRLTGPELDTPRIEDIAHHLAQINRFTGAASRPYSVAEHSLLCEHIAASEGAGPMARLCALMHDAHEAYTSDMASPAKLAMRYLTDCDTGVMIGSCYDAFEDNHSWNVRHAFDLLGGFAKHGADVRRWDLIALATERRDLMPNDGDGWGILEGVEAFGKPHEYVDPKPVVNWEFYKNRFFNRYCFLRRLNDESCCQNERRGMAGGCLNCGAPCF